MFNSDRFLIFANQRSPQSLFAGGTALNFYRDFVNDKQLNGPISNFRLGPDIKFIRNSFGTFFNELCTLQVSGINVPRFEYTPNGLGLYKGLLIEGQRTNFVEYSNNFSTSTWLNPNSGVSLSANVPGIVAPDGTFGNVTLMTLTTTSGPHVLSWGETDVPPFGAPASSAEYYDRNIFVKKKDARYVVFSTSPVPSAPTSIPNPPLPPITAVNFDNVSTIFDLDNPGFVQLSYLNSTYQTLPNGWYRISFNRTSANSNTNRLTVGLSNGPNYEDTFFTPNANSLSGVYIWGGQVEKGIYSTSYIPTNGGQVTRAGDDATVDGKNFSTIYFLSGASAVVKASRLSNTNKGSFVSYANNITTKYWTIGSLISGDYHSLVNTSMFNSISTGPVNSDQIYAVGASLSSNNFTLYQNGTFAGNITNGELPQPPARLTQLQIGRLGPQNYLDGHIRTIAHWPARLSNQQLALSTTI